jgi:flagellar biosynthesis/type III secretory pathway M-ring protein FliF/YscJ
MNESLNEQGLYDIYGHSYVPFWQTAAFKITLMAAGILLLFLVAYFIIKKLFINRELCAAQKALKALEALKQKKIQSREDAHEAYFTITNILKRFFQVHYGIPFESMTDLEMVELLKKTDFPVEHVSPLGDMIEASIGVKYAQEAALQQDVSRDIARSIALITRIKTHYSKA